MCNLWLCEEKLWTLRNTLLAPSVCVHAYVYALKYTDQFFSVFVYYICYESPQLDTGVLKTLQSMAM